ncbi:hypothetical protein AVEN_80391-1 [Araneus ventricosus]|uniref:BTB domain-containing protein n=1 Tax=Araneus ventricosus TaxID=182803 RepID=A0A4Y2SAN0_ARAVE|nr:hypothetical protein AVEN_80391-1 [Araneus ventricosus]
MIRRIILQSNIEDRKRMQCQKQKFDDDSSDPYEELDSSSDAVLRTEDGNKFKINRNLLAGICPFFKALSAIFASEADALPCPPPPSLAALVDRKGFRFLQCHRFVVIHFEEIMSQSEEIGNLPLEALKKILKENGLNVSDERTVWNVIVRWLKFDLPDRLRFVPELLKCISLEDVDEALVNDIIFHNLIQENNFCQELILGELQDTAHLQNFLTILDSKSKT